MGSAASKAPKRAFLKPQQVQKAAAPIERNGPPRPDGSGFAEEPSPLQEQDFLQQLKREGVKDNELGSFLDKLGGAIAGKQVSTLDVKTSRGVQAELRSNKGRLGTEDLRRLFHEIHQMEKRQGQPDISGLAKRFGVDSTLLEKVVRFNRVPAITQTPDGRLLGSWHATA